MSALGDLLELLHGARGRFRTVRGVALQDVDLVRAQEAEERRYAGRSRGVTTQLVLAGSPGAQPPTRHRVRTRFWLEGRDRGREETEHLDPAGPGTVSVWDRGRWWSWTPGHGDPVSNAVDGGEPEDPEWGPGTLDALLDPAGLIPAFELELAGETTAAGRPALVVRCRPRGGRADLHAPFLAGGDEHELLVDREVGVLLRHAALLDGEPFSVHELEEVAVDEEPPPGTFRFEPPPGVEVRSAASLAAEPVSLDEARGRVPFAVFHLPELPEGRWRLHAMLLGHEPSLHLAYFREDAVHHLQLAQSERREGAQPGAFPAGGEPQTVERDGVRYLVVPPAPEAGNHAAVLWERDGTALQLSSSTLGADELVALAVSAVPYR